MTLGDDAVVWASSAGEYRLEPATDGDVFYMSDVGHRNPVAGER
jgi:hypothetical protein